MSERFVSASVVLPLLLVAAAACSDQEAASRSAAPRGVELDKSALMRTETPSGHE
ncbi:MAG: hypothetical protein JWN48_840 [Myxococcaceae bacterium]|nr:hypothetical protein [Myxococcaceae bacterium]